jgi:hypothetical protein
MQQGGRGALPDDGSHGPKKKKKVGPLPSPVAEKAEGAAKKAKGTRVSLSAEVPPGAQPH